MISNHSLGGGALYKLSSPEDFSNVETQQKTYDLKSNPSSLATNSPEAKGYISKIFNRIGGYTQKAGKKLLDKAKFWVYSLRGTVEDFGIPTKRSYWKEHPVDAVLTTVGVIFGIGTGSCDLYVLSDPSVRYKISSWKVPTDTVFIPPNIPYYSSDLEMIKRRFLNSRDYLSLALPLILFGLSLGIEGVRYHRWKKSIQQE